MVRGKKLSDHTAKFVLVLFFVLFPAIMSVRVVAQTTPEVPSSEPESPSIQSPKQSNPANAYDNPVTVQPAPAVPSPEETQKRIERARALAAAHQLEAAASELETVRATSREPVVREGTSIMLMGIYLESVNYTRAQSLLEEAFQSRGVMRDSSIRSYFALAGQAVNGVRLHLARYRNFGVTIDNGSLPAESINDLDRSRSLLERMAAQAKDVMKDPVSANDGLALLEDVLGVRVLVARDTEDRERWQAEYTQAREQLSSGRIEIASLGGLPPRATTNQPGRVPPVTSSGNTTQPAAAVANSTSQLQVVNAGLLNERASKRVIPAYPQIAKTARAQGSVKVHVIINERGEVEVTKTEGPTLLRQAAEDAARGWRFAPTLVDGKLVRLAGYIEFNFGL